MHTQTKAIIDGNSDFLVPIATTGGTPKLLDARTLDHKTLTAVYKGTYNINTLAVCHYVLYGELFQSDDVDRWLNQYLNISITDLDGLHDVLQKLSGSTIIPNLPPWCIGQDRLDAWATLIAQSHKTPWFPWSVDMDWFFDYIEAALGQGNTTV